MHFLITRHTSVQNFCQVFLWVAFYMEIWKFLKLDDSEDRPVMSNGYISTLSSRVMIHTSYNSTFPYRFF